MREITLVGYGNQGKPWAANLRDSGWKVTVSGRAGGKGIAQAKADGFATISAASLKEVQGPLALLLPDEAIPSFFHEFLSKGANRQFIFCHGFAVTFGALPVSPSDDLLLVAAKGIGPKLRENYLAGSGVMGVLDVRQDASGRGWPTAEAVAEGLGLTRVGILKASFDEETKTDLLTEQVVLCGAVPRLVTETVDFLVEKGIDRRLAEYECLNELKLVVDMMVEHGVDGMLQKVSRAAFHGGAKAADIVVPKPELRARTEKLWQDIGDGTFARELAAKTGHAPPAATAATVAFGQEKEASR
ncbi:MAG: ketol-acid reductoisomerase [Proteobacteria bacterium]|nr:MAG: ketol-acid reductoisomerase [Pseudomonadota bacterium]